MVFSFRFLVTGWSNETSMRSSFSFPQLFQFIWQWWQEEMLPPFCHPCLEIHLSNLCLFFLFADHHLLLFVQKLYHLLFTRPTQHLSFALNHLSWARETNCLNCYLLLLFQCCYYLLLIFCFVMNGTSDWQFFLWASTTLTKVMWCLRYYEIYTLSRLLDICHIGLFYFHMIANDDAKFLL